MNSKNLKMVLNAIGNMIKKNRVAYKDYLGEETVDEVICEGVYTGGQIILPIKNPRRFKAGDTYQVSIDEVVSVWICKIVQKGTMGIGPLIDYVIEHNKEPNDPTGMWAIFYNSNENDGGYRFIADSTSFTGKNFVVSQTITRKKYDIKKLPEELLPDATVKKIQALDVSALESEISHTTEVAQTAYQLANNALPKSGGFISGNVSDPYKTVFGISVIKLDSSGEKDTTVTASLNHNSTRIWKATKSGKSSMVLDLAPTIQSYGAGKRNFFTLSTYTSGSGINEIAEETVINVSLVKEVTMLSSTPGSTKKFKITVDDTGTLMATEVT